MISAEYIPYPDPEMPLRIIRHLGTFERDAYPTHVHEDITWECCYIVEGRVRAVLGGRPRTLGPGEALVIRPDEPHGFDAWAGRHLTLLFRQPVLENTPLGVPDGGPPQLRVAQRPLPAHVTVASQRRAQVEHVLELLRQESLGEDPMRPVMCSLLLSQLLVELVRSAAAAPAEAEAPSPAAQQTVEQFCAELRANLDHPWTLSEMVTRSGYSASQLSLFFRQVTALSPCRWLAEERIHRARHLLATTDRKITEIAFEVGFGSLCQFGRMFGEIVGTSPSGYRALMQSRESPQDLQPPA